MLGTRSQLGLVATKLTKPYQRQWIQAFSLSKRFVSNEAILDSQNIGEEDDATRTGVIQKGSQETLLYFGTVIPFKSNRWDIKQYLTRFWGTSEVALRKRITDLCSNTPTSCTFDIEDIITIPRDGGVFVKFVVPETTTVAEFNKNVTKHVAKNSKRGILNRIMSPTVHPVKGIPWIEDLRRYPSNQIEVEFEGPPLTQEDMYLLFRRYGELIDIKPATDANKKAQVSFKSTSSAINARHCITGLNLGGTYLHIQYIPIVRHNVIKDSIANHPRIAFPIIIAILASLAVLIFDPIRSFFIKEKITQRYSLNKLWRSSLFKSIIGFFSITKDSLRKLITTNEYHTTGSFALNQSAWGERLARVEELKLLLKENINSFIVVVGPKGTGKREIVFSHVLSDRANVLHLDCDELIKARSEASFLKAVAHQVGYYPSFPWFNSLFTYVDLVTQGLTGQKTGLNESKEKQIKNMLFLTASTIRGICLACYSNYLNELSCEGDTLPLKEEDFLQQYPDVKPVIVIDRFQASKKANETNAFIYKELADWAGKLVTLNIAHVIYLTDDVGSLQVLSDVLPDNVFKVIPISDASFESSKSYVLSQFEESKVTEKFVEEVQETIRPLGGRMSDLQAYMRRLNSGETPTGALEEMVDQTAEQLMQVFLNKGHNTFGPAEVWALIKMLNDQGSVKYKDLLLNPLFKSNGKQILTEMEKSELVCLTKTTGLITEIRAGKPLYEEVFKHLVANKDSFRELESNYLKSLITLETGKISKWEDELSKFPENSSYFKTRFKYLDEKITTSNNLIIDYEKKIKDLTT
ncbi:Mitochondrial nucleoid structure and number manteinance [Komagataella phaffii CBS 7435]|uniref:Mitochondrial escape protein 2 n=2 Tax=Komagataella phaffii TaxID=460519 RepID=C4R2V7_KOMPG|nr:Integral inner mitochondrial membrane protein [Komagataella phaffii GS115]AOA61968.1 GQ67_01249T0 [Komagataella phaffii]CAH2447613.1 Mitochondrial nucleoid structure and number manteinance [Komagataella phaffii CBS 7435]AOA67218.1 GQ68_00141T0 [Komagataella phaffii GS115]CAY69831.1 Integral inner mitochondrial membrane protein [Komagataella phaffii GS115]CCA37799.1 Mitochondrial nucleoid structure and number manteinance [Komagataella phaffii CBS 7435]